LDCLAYAIYNGCFWRNDTYLSFHVEKAIRRLHYLRLIIRKIRTLRQQKMKRTLNLISDRWIDYSYVPISDRPGYERGMKSFYDQQN